MNVIQERSRSLWMDVAVPREPSLAANISTDVLVIGGGIAGLSTAYELIRSGADVVVVDRGPIAGGMTSRTTAHLSWEPDDYYDELITLRGEEKARHYFESQSAAVSRIEEIAKHETIACDFARVDLFLFAPDKKGRHTLEKEIEAATRIGFEGVTWTEPPVAGRSEGCLRFPRQARFHPRKYLSGLSKAIQAKGGRLYADTPIVTVEEERGRVVAKSESGFTIEARSVVLATNTPFVDKIAIHTKQAPYRTYVIAATIEKGGAPDALIWDTLDPYHYVRLQKQNGELFLICGGEDHKTGTADDAKARLRRLEQWARKRFPALGEVRYRWSGQVYEPVDYTPFIGQSPGHKSIFVVTGDSGSGITMGVTASLILPDLIAGRENPWTDVYAPARKPLSPTALATFVKENVGASAHLAEHALPLGTSEPVRRGTGAVVASLGKGVAVYRDEDGVKHRMSASCTHIGCVVQWNSFERCWDCPCHGSQFAPTGEVLQGPAVTALPALEESARADRTRRRAGRKTHEHHGGVR